MYVIASTHVFVFALLWLAAKFHQIRVQSGSALLHHSSVVTLVYVSALSQLRQSGPFRNGHLGLFTPVLHQFSQIQHRAPKHQHNIQLIFVIKHYIDGSTKISQKRQMQALCVILQMGRLLFVVFITNLNNCARAGLRYYRWNASVSQLQLSGGSAPRRTRRAACRGCRTTAVPEPIRNRLASSGIRSHVKKKICLWNQIRCLPTFTSTDGVLFSPVSTGADADKTISSLNFSSLSLILVRFCVFSLSVFFQCFLSTAHYISCIFGSRQIQYIA